MQHGTTAVVQVNRIVKRGILTLSIPAVSLIYPILNVYKENINVLRIPIDNVIPFVKEFSIPYICWYGYVCFFLFLLCVFDSKEYFKLLTCLNIGMLICYTVYFFYPTYVARPTIEKGDIFNNLVLWVYKRDNPYNCMPSIHVLNSMLVMLFINVSKEVNCIYKIICITIGILICLSTMFIKQHYFIDVITGMGLYYILYYVVNLIWKSKVKPLTY